jgi:hypothetical protein
MYYIITHYQLEKQGCATAQVLFAIFSPHRPGFVPKAVHMGYVVDKVALGQAFLRVFRFFSCQYHSTTVSYSLMYHLGNGKWAC